MKTLVVLNKNAGSFEKAARLISEYEGKRDVTFHACASSAEVPRLVQEAIGQGAEVVAAGGGDGTIHEVVNALAGDLEKVKFGIIPLGTGNDLSRTFDIPVDPVEALELIINNDTAARSEEPIDLIQISDPASKKAICVNLASGGMGGEIEKNVDKPLKERWGALAYARAALTTATNLKKFDLTLSIDGQSGIGLSALSIIVANGKAAGGGFEVAPHADPQDKKMDIVVVHAAPTVALATIAARLIAGDYTQSEYVTHFRAHSLKVSANPRMDFSVDGNLFGRTPLTFSIMPSALRLITKKARESNEAA